MIPAVRSSRIRRLRPAVSALEGRALLSGAAHPAVKAPSKVHVEASPKAPAPAPPSIKLLNVVGTYRFHNFDGPAPAAGFAPKAGAGTNANGIANSGTVVGFVIDNNGAFNNFATTPTRSTRATLVNPAGSNNPTALGINASGTVVGTDGNGGAFALKGKQLATFVPPGATTATAFGINDRGTVVGQEVIGTTSSPGFIRVKANSYITINAPNGSGAVNAQGINNNDLVVGFYVGADGNTHGFVANQKAAKGGTLTATAIPDPVIPAVAGEPGATLVFSQVLGVNDKGLAVGYYGDSTGSQHGFIYNTKTGQYSFLDDPSQAFDNAGVEVTQITGITNSAEISGFYTDAAGVAHGFVSTYKK